MEKLQIAKGNPIPSIANVNLLNVFLPFEVVLFYLFFILFRALERHSATLSAKGQPHLVQTLRERTRTIPNFSNRKYI